MRGDDEHQTAHTPIALMLCPKLENLATMPRRAQAQHKCEDNIISPLLVRASLGEWPTLPVLFCRIDLSLGCGRVQQV